MYAVSKKYDFMPFGDSLRDYSQIFSTSIFFILFILIKKKKPSSALFVSTSYWKIKIALALWLLDSAAFYLCSLFSPDLINLWGKPKTFPGPPTCYMLPFTMILSLLLRFLAVYVDKKALKLSLNYLLLSILIN